VTVVGFQYDPFVSHRCDVSGDVQVGPVTLEPRIKVPAFPSSGNKHTTLRTFEYNPIRIRVGKRCFTSHNKQ
jgi:hypothetical protein